MELNPFALGPLIGARIQEEIPGMTVTYPKGMPTLEVSANLPPAVLIILDEEHPPESFDNGKSIKRSQTWAVVHITNSAEEAGVMIQSTIAALDGWKPTGSFYHPIRHTASGQQTWSLNGIHHYVLYFSVIHWPI